MAENKYSVVLEKVGDQPLMTTKILCGALGLGLAAAKSMVDKAPSTVATELDGAKALDLKKKLEEIGNTVSIPGLETKAVAPASTEKVTEPKKTAAKKSVPSPLTVTASSNNDFDAIFGNGTAKKKAASPAKTKDSAKPTPKAKADKISAAPNDEFDAIFGKGK